MFTFGISPRGVGEDSDSALRRRFLREGILCFEDVKTVRFQPLHLFDVFCTDQSPSEARADSVTCLIELWVCRRGTLFRVVGQ